MRRPEVSNQIVQMRAGISPVGVAVEDLGARSQGSMLHRVFERGAGGSKKDPDRSDQSDGSRPQKDKDLERAYERIKESRPEGGSSPRPRVLTPEEENGRYNRRGE